MSWTLAVELPMLARTPRLEEHHGSYGLCLGLSVLSVASNLEVTGMPMSSDADVCPNLQAETFAALM